MKKKSDTELREAVLRELARDPRLAGSEIGVRVETGVVTLLGSVDGWAKRQSAQEAAHRVSGVLDVANDVSVVLPASAARTDAELARVVRETLEWDVLVPDDKITSSVSDGQIVLSGEVPEYRQAEQAELAVANLAGVVAVHNRIRVVPPPIDAGTLRKAITLALQRQAEDEASRLQLRVDGGHVTVSGSVRSLLERDVVLGAVRRTSGVCTVKDELRIEPYAA